MYLVGNLKEMKVEDMSLQDWLDMFQGKNEDGQLEIIRKLLEEKGFHHKIVKKHKKPVKTFDFGDNTWDSIQREYIDPTETEWFWKEGAAHVFAVATNINGDRLLIIMPADYAKARYTNKNGEFTKYICIQRHGTNELVAKFKSFRLHQDIYNFYGIDFGDLQIDHICGHPGVYVFKELRPCTNEQNSRNKRGLKVKKGDPFDLNPRHDFRDSFWIPFLHYVLDVISYKNMDDLRRMELEAQGN